MKPAKSLSIPVLFFLALSWLLPPATGRCQSPQGPADPATSLADLGRSVQESIALEKSSLAHYQDQLKNLQSLKLSLAAAANAYQIQLSTYGNLLLSPNADIGAIEKAWSEIRASLAGLDEQIATLTPRRENVGSELENTRQQQALVARQIAELRKMSLKKAEARDLLRQAGRLNDLLGEKEKILQELQQIYNSRIERLQQARQSFNGLSARFEKQVGERKTRDLFQRRKSPLSAEAWNRLVAESAQVVGQMRRILSPRFWVRETIQLWQGAGMVLISFCVLLVVFAALLVRLRRGLRRLESHPVRESLGPWHLLALRLADGSLLLAGMTAFVYLCSALDAFYLTTPSIRLAAHLLLVALLTRWGRLTLSLWAEESRLSSESAVRLRRLLKTVRYFAWGHLLLQWALGPGAGLLLVIRFAFELWMIGWLVFFWRFVERRRRSGKFAANIERLRYLIAVGKVLGYIVAGAALMLDMVGYGALSVHWLVSWGRSLAVALWWAVIFFLLREWDYFYREKSARQRDELLHDEYPVQWLMIRFGQLLWLISVGIVLILAWGGKQVVLAKIYRGLGHSIQIGSMNFSFLGLLYAVIALLATQAVARLWRWIFQTKFLSKSGMEAGLQDSITTITVYVIWMMGILIALHVFGLNTASLAVAFGALGIGLGFGLQNIFNNFVSGIILLFERPIQVGDDVEINGTWATVKKINVRSTVVQTYDNASLIIPNSDFVSSQVTNWSFKDKRLRRSIVVGVAYGSDIDRVRDTLLEIARSVPKVLKHPAPDVLFSDFGDSALIFRLRIWTDIDSMLKVETAVRFEIDRLFKERGIEISFPQRDLHIRSWEPAARVQVENDKEADSAAEKGGADRGGKTE